MQAFNNRNEWNPLEIVILIGLHTFPMMVLLSGCGRYLTKESRLQPIATPTNICTSMICSQLFDCRTNVAKTTAPRADRKGNKNVWQKGAWICLTNTHRSSPKFTGLHWNSSEVTETHRNCVSLVNHVNNPRNQINFDSQRPWCSLAVQPPHFSMSPQTHQK